MFSYHYFSILRSLIPFNISVYLFGGPTNSGTSACFINPPMQAGGFTNQSVPFQAAASQQEGVQFSVP